MEDGIEVEAKYGNQERCYWLEWERSDIRVALNEFS